MRNPVERDEIQKDVVLKKCFDCLVETGIENATIRDFSRITEMTTSSLQYWFSDKDEIVLDATEFGIRMIVDALFEYAIKHIKNIKEMCSEFPGLARKYSSALKVVFQIAASPTYGSQITKLTIKFSQLYDEYAKKLAEQLDIPYQKVRPLVDLFISSIIDCVLWDEWDKLSREIDCILGELTDS